MAESDTSEQGPFTLNESPSHLLHRAQQVASIKSAAALKAAGVPLADIFENPRARSHARRLKLADLSPLQGLTNLQTLACPDTPVSDLSPLQDLANLQRLDCGETPVSDLSPLQGLANLQELRCSHTQVSDLSPLQGLANLQELRCMFTQVSNWSPVDHVDRVYGRPQDWPRKKTR